jgi:hypothetical protein
VKNTRCLDVCARACAVVNASFCASKDHGSIVGFRSTAFALNLRRGGAWRMSELENDPLTVGISTAACNSVTTVLIFNIMRVRVEKFLALADRTL